MKNVGMWTVCLVCSGLRHCEHIITIKVIKHLYLCMLFRKDVVVLKIMGKGGIQIISLFSWLYAILNVVYCNVIVVTVEKQ
jgi:hypothetical protein